MERVETSSKLVFSDKELEEMAENDRKFYDVLKGFGPVVTRRY